MLKKILSLALCLLMIVPLLASCGGNIKGDNISVGPHIYMYLADEVYDFDPINAYTNDSTLKLASLMFEPLFKLNENGKVTTDGLVESYEIIKNEKDNEYKMMLTLKESYWSDSTYISAGDIVYSWKRIMEVDASSPAAALLYDIKNARAVKEGDKSIDYLGIYDVEELKLEIVFEGDIDYDQFLINLTSYCLCPVREDIATKALDSNGKMEDWAKKSSTIVCSGPFVLRESYYSPSHDKDEVAGLVLERNPYYYRDQLTDQYDKYVKISKIYVDWSLSEDDIIALYDEGQICYIGEVPVSYRADLADEAKIEDALSTHTYFLNTNKEPFNNEKVRQALSLAIDREAIVDTIVYGKVADALVPYGVFDSTPKSNIFGTKVTQFRDNGDSYLSSSADLAAAKSLLQSAGIKAGSYSFKITYAANDTVHKLIAEAIAKAWGKQGLGFNVTLEPVRAKPNDDKLISTGEAATDICDDIFNERLTSGDFDVVALDLVAYSANAFQLLAQFAPAFSGEAMDMTQTDANGNPIYTSSTHITGFNNQEYNDLINAIYYLPFISTINEETNYEDFSIYDSDEEFRADIEKVKAIYEKYGISTEFKGYSKEQAKLLHEAERLLMEKLPVIPIVYNQNAYIVSKSLKKVKSDYYGNRDFRKTTLKGADDYMYYYELGIYDPSYSAE